MELEVYIRVEADLTPEDKEKIHHLVTADEFYSEDDYRQENDLYKYVPLCFDMRDVRHYHRIDREHTMVKVNDSYFIGRVSYQQFKSIREKMLGIEVKTLKDFS